MNFEMTADPPFRIGMLTPSSNTVVEPVVESEVAPSDDTKTEATEA